MNELIALLITAVFIFAVYDKIKNSIFQNNKNKWIAVMHSFDSNSKLYKAQHILNRHGIKSRVEFDDAPTNHAVRSFYIGNKGSICKLLVLEKDLSKVKRLLEEMQ